MISLILRKCKCEGLHDGKWYHGCEGIRDMNGPHDCTMPKMHGLGLAFVRACGGPDCALVGACQGGGGGVRLCTCSSSTGAAI